MSRKPALLPRRVQTPIGVLPADWEVKQLGENAYIKARIGWRGLSADEYTKDGPLLVAGTHIRGAHIDWMSCDHVSDFRYEESPEIQLQEGDVILSKDGTLGRVGIVERLPGRATINGTMMLIRPKRDTFESKFLYNYLQGRNFRRFIKEKVSGSSVPHIFQRDMVRLIAPSPPLPEQRKIAAILSSVDDAIEKTQAVIDQVQVVKRGLMQELFTRGLPGRHTRLKRTVIGDVPNVWEVKTVGAVAAPGGRSCIGGPFGSDLIRKDYVDSPGVPVIRGSNLAGSSGWLKEDDFVFVSDTKAKTLQRNTASPGDVIVTQRGTLGQVCMIPMQSRFPRYVLSQSQMRVSVDERQVSPEFLLAYFRSSRALKQIEAMTIGTGVPHLNLGILRAFPVPVPALEEQRVIVRYLSATDARIDSELRSLRTFKVLKSALMSVLLTGELRVTPDPQPE